MKSKPIQKILSALFSLTLLAGCAPQMPTGPMAGFPRAPMFGRFSAQTGANSLLMTDNFTAWQRAEEAQAGFDPDAPSVPVDGETVAQLPAGGAAKTLTYMSYEALDNNLFDDLNRILDTLELVGSNPQMNLLAQTDNFGPGNAARYFIKNDPMTGPISSPHLKLGNAAENFGDPRVLSDAVRWGFTAYPARFNWLNVSSHGKGFAGIAFDDTPAASMNIVSFAQAVKAGLGARKLDILSFDACLMATVEVASELQDSSNILVGSEDSTYYWGHGFQQTFSRIAQNPAAMNPDQVVRSLVVDVNHRGANDMAYTVSATDLRKLGLLEAELDRLARALRRVMPQAKADILRAVKASQEFHLAAGKSPEDVPPFRDINRLVSLLKQNVRDAEIAQICDQINNVMFRRGVIMFARQSKLEQGQGRGLSIYLPSDGKVSQLYRQTRFARATQWDEFLIELNS